jgi:5-formyltetrahydrofolate cyclo-ligase
MNQKELELKIIELCNNYNNIFIYISKDDEVNTINIIKELLKLKKNIIVPICDINNNQIILSKLDGINNLKKSNFGILEPIEIIPFLKEDIDIFFIPGTKFDKFGNRKGRGKGYFDRLLENVNQEKLIGLCYKDQFIDKIEHLNKWDVPVCKVYACETK